MISIPEKSCLRNRKICKLLCTAARQALIFLPKGEIIPCPSGGQGMRAVFGSYYTGMVPSSLL